MPLLTADSADGSTDPKTPKIDEVVLRDAQNLIAQAQAVSRELLNAKNRADSSFEKNVRSQPGPQKQKSKPSVKKWPAKTNEVKDKDSLLAKNLYSQLTFAKENDTKSIFNRAKKPPPFTGWGQEAGGGGGGGVVERDLDPQDFYSSQCGVSRKGGFRFLYLLYLF